MKNYRYPPPYDKWYPVSVVSALLETTIDTVYHLIRTEQIEAKRFCTRTRRAYRYRVNPESITTLHSKPPSIVIVCYNERYTSRKEIRDILTAQLGPENEMWYLVSSLPEEEELILNEEKT